MCRRRVHGPHGQKWCRTPNRDGRCEHRRRREPRKLCGSRWRSRRCLQRNVDDQTAAATDEGLRGLQPDQLVTIIRQALQFKQPLPRNVYEAVRLELPAELKHRAEASNLRRGFGADYVRPV